LFAYAVLGPLHYLTEISWLHERKYFLPSRSWGARIFILACIALSVPWAVALYAWPIEWTALLFLLALGIAAAPAGWRGTAAAIALSLLAAWVISFNAPLVALFALLVPTLIHVYVFTGCFILGGVLRAPSGAGWLSIAAFILCPLILFLADFPLWLSASKQVMDNYFDFGEVNEFILNSTGLQNVEFYEDIFEGRFATGLMRFIAFAYTYHYLNWFSKTSLIKWHKVSKLRLGAIGTLWLASIGLYFYDYRLGLQALAALSVLHVYLEFPLNHRSFRDIGGHLAALVQAPRARRPAA
jgi:hypothetical protein